ncbi:MAG: hypothetical protein WDO74_32615 [Pseudomonadota bacterium]
MSCPIIAPPAAPLTSSTHPMKPFPPKLVELCAHLLEHVPPVGDAGVAQDLPCTRDENLDDG